MAHSKWVIWGNFHKRTLQKYGQSVRKPQGILAVTMEWFKGPEEGAGNWARERAVGEDLLAKAVTFSGRWQECRAGAPSPWLSRTVLQGPTISAQSAGAPRWAGRDVLRLHLSLRSSGRVLPPSFHRCQSGIVVCRLSLPTPLPFIFHKFYWRRIPYNSNFVLASTSWITHTATNSHPLSCQIQWSSQVLQLSRVW